MRYLLSGVSRDEVKVIDDESVLASVATRD